MQCHQGRESKSTVDSRIARVPGIKPDETREFLRAELAKFRGIVARAGLQLGR